MLRFDEDNSLLVKYFSVVKNAHFIVGKNS